MQKILTIIIATISLLISSNVVAQEQTSFPLSEASISDTITTLSKNQLIKADSIFFEVFSTETVRKTTTDTQEAKKKNKNFKFSLLGGPGYSPDYGFTLGISTLMTFKTVKSDTSLIKSVIPIHFSMSFGCPIGFTVLSRPYIYFKKDRIRLQGYYEYKHTTENYYGVGYT
ncbi:MAG: hypothetical protein IKY54_00855, partial [Muribaculaceae bacterium]|nr:hypothetical protein [Muribaculaceae bacterium]